MTKDVGFHVFDANKYVKATAHTPKTKADRFGENNESAKAAPNATRRNTEYIRINQG
jgi:hypothetical protein